MVVAVAVEATMACLRASVRANSCVDLGQAGRGEHLLNVKEVTGLLQNKLGGPLGRGVPDTSCRGVTDIVYPWHPSRQNDYGFVYAANQGHAPISQKRRTFVQRWGGSKSAAVCLS